MVVLQIITKSVTWASHKQQTVALSSCEAEFMAATAAACQALWLRNMVSFLTGEEAQRVQLLVDNQSAIALMKNPVFHGRSIAHLLIQKAADESNDDLIEIIEIHLNWIELGKLEYTLAMAKEDAFLIDYVEGGLCVDNTDAIIGGRCNSGSNKGIRQSGERDTYCRGHILNLVAEDSSSKKFLSLAIEESLRAQDSDKGKGKEVGGPSVNMTEEVKTKQQTKQRFDALVVDRLWCYNFMLCKDRCWFKTFEPVEDGSVLYMGDEHFAPIHGKGSVALEFRFNFGKIVTLFAVCVVEPKLRKELCGLDWLLYHGFCMFMLNLNKVPDDSDSVYMSSSTVVNSTLWHARLGHDEALDKFRIYKTEVELQQNDLVKTLRTDRGGEYYDPVFFQSVGIIHETTAPYTPQQNGVAERKNRALKEMVNSMLSYSGLSEGFWGEAMAVVRLTDPKRKTLGEKGIDCIFVGYAEHSKAYRFYVIEPNDSVSINSIIESRDAIFDENRFSSIPRPKDIIPNLGESQRDDHSDDVPSETPEPRRGKRAKKAKSYGSDFQLYLVEGSRDQVGSQYSYCYSIEEDPRTYNEAVQSRDAAFWKEAIDDEIGSIMENNTWVLSDLPPGCKPLGCKWIFKRKMKVDGTIDKFKARLVIQGFRQKEGIDYFDTYAPVARITTIRLLLALAAIHNLVIHQMDVKTTFLNGDLDEEVYMKQPMDLLCLVYKFINSNPSRAALESYNEGVKLLKKVLRIGLSYVGYPSVLEGYSDASWINHVEESSSTSGWVFLLGGGAISWASKKQTCITSSTMESEFVALVCRCDSAPTMARAYSQIYNGKSRHLGVRHSMVRELIRNGVISIDFVRTQHNLADLDGKGIARTW
ncbi:zinc finger, CCHC-type containing protein [Tanacetum coccineum]